MIRINQFYNPEENSLSIAGEIGLHLKSQQAEKLNTLMTTFIRRHMKGGNTLFVESLLLLYALGKIRYNSVSDEIEYIK